MNHYLGMFRAQVVDNKDPEFYGRVKVWIPDIMPEISQDCGLIANPANNPVGGRNTNNANSNYIGTSFIPKIGSWVWVFFEAGNINKPYYFGSLEIENAKVLPENQMGSNPSDKWVIFKSSKGRTIVISDDEDDKRIEITGEKRQIKNPPSGDTDSVYQIDGNQTSILFDERNGKEKILIRTHNGDFFHIDIDEQQLHVKFKNDIHIKSDSNIFLSAQNINIKSLESVKLQANDINIKGENNVAIDGTNTLVQSGAAQNAQDAQPVGERNT